jgi:hypothetical protein
VGESFTKCPLCGKGYLSGSADGTGVCPACRALYPRSLLEAYAQRAACTIGLVSGTVFYAPRVEICGQWVRLVPTAVDDPDGWIEVWSDATEDRGSPIAEPVDLRADTISWCQCHGD